MILDTAIFESVLDSENNEAKGKKIVMKRNFYLLHCIHVMIFVIESKMTLKFPMTNQDQTKKTMRRERFVSGLKKK